ncbi:hypothetical protein K4H00_23750, partial [Mycobacterium tuberculosis]|nr:hypothetical protein [Mycobacterium tuberculosis]
ELQFLLERQEQQQMKQTPNLTKNYNCSISFFEFSTKKDSGKCYTKQGFHADIETPLSINY